MSETLEKVAVQTEESRTQTRRAFIKGGLAVAGTVMFTKAAEAAYDPKSAAKAYAGKKEITDVLADGPQRRMLGKGIMSTTYSMPSMYEKEVRKRTLEWLTPDTLATISMTPIQSMHGMIVPNGLHFDRFHGGAPDIDPATHKLVIHGLVERPLMFTMDDLKRMPSVSRVYFLECPANGALEWKGIQVNSVQWTHGMMSCSEWTGVPLSVLLKEAGVKPEGKWLLPEGADASGLIRSIPMEIALDDCMVAYAMNGEALRPSQGYPIRLVVPGCEGNMWVKYLRRIKVTDKPLHHREESSKYSELMPDGTIQRFSWVQETNSVITYPSPDYKMSGPGRYVAKGIAWSGRGRITHVDVSLDGGKNWKEAKFTSVALPKAWTRFEFEFDWDGSEMLLMSRATDETGYVQPPMTQLRNAVGTNGVYHRTAMVTWLIHDWKGNRAGEIENVQF